jgi:hypothetical protein
MPVDLGKTILDGIKTFKLLCESNDTDCDDLAILMEKHLQLQQVTKILKGYTNITITDDIKKIMHDQYTAEMYQKYLGFKSNVTNMCQFVRENVDHPIFQAVLVDKHQQLIFKYSGDDHKQLNSELSNMYPKAVISHSFDNVIVGLGYENYHDAYNEFTDLKTRLTPNIAKQCHAIELQKIGNSDKLGILYRIESKPVIGDMYPTVINYIDKRIMVNGDHNTVQVGDHNVVNNHLTPLSRDDIHREWVENNPPTEGEKSRDYYNRAKLLLAKPLSETQHGTLVKSLGYISHRKSSGRHWSHTVKN